MKRQRGRGGQRKPGGGGYQPNRAFESNGPDVKVRGPAAHIYEKYMQLARDANSAGDRIQAENYLQHAEHYFRVVRAMQPVAPPPTFNDRYGTDLDFDGEGEEGGEALEGAVEGEGGERPQHQQQQRDREWQPRGEYQQRNRGEYQQREPREPRGEYQQRDRGEYQPREQRDPQPRDQQPREPRAEFEPRDQQQALPREPREGDEQGELAASGEEGAEGPRRNRRGRRNRYRDGERPAPREGEQQSGPVEGFGDSVPAFVGNE